MLIPKPREVEVKHVMITINQCKVEIMNSREVEVKHVMITIQPHEVEIMISINPCEVEVKHYSHTKWRL